MFDAKTGENSEKFTIVTLEKGEFGLKPTLGEGRHSGGLYRPTEEREVLATVYRKEGHYWKQVPIPLPP